MIKAWRYWIIRPNAPFIASQFAMVAVALLYDVWDGRTYSIAGPFHEDLGLLLVFLIFQLCFYFNGLRTLLVGAAIRPFLAKTLSSAGISLLLATVLFLIFPGLFPGFGRTAAAAGLLTGAVLGLRPLVLWLVRRKKFVEGLLVLGSEETAGKFYRELVHGNGANLMSRNDARLGSGNGLRLIHGNGTNGNGNGNGHRNGHENGKTGSEAQSRLALVYDHLAAGASDAVITFQYEELAQIIERDGISRIVLAEPNAPHSEAMAIALLDCKLRGLEIEQVAESYERFNGKLWLECIRPEWLVCSDGFRPPRYYSLLKRALDVVCAVLILLVSLPLLALIALAIRLDSEGPVLFRQARVGLHGRTFELFKFRTMRVDAEQATGPVWAAPDDPRATRVGRVLRKFRLDELPQAWNMLCGEMSLVGPRPERPHFVQLLGIHVPYYGLRHSVKPGITGWAQVLYQYGASIQDSYEKLQYDLYYAKHMSLGFDLLIVLQTVQVVLFGRGR